MITKSITLSDIASNLVMSMPGGFADNIVAAGPITKQPATMAFRVVLRVSNSKTGFVVHNQQFVKYPELTEFDFYQGNYFSIEKIEDAVKCFAERILKGAVHIPSILRDL